LFYLIFCNFLTFNTFKVINIKAWGWGREAQYTFNFVCLLIHLSLATHVNAMLMLTQNAGPWLSLQASQNT
jgi:hypothetical protein